MLTGRPLRAEEFIFVVLDNENNVVTFAKNTENGTFAFTLHFAEAGTYRYTIAEKNNAVEGVVYDEKTYAVEITIVDRNGVLAAESVIYKQNENTVDKVVFENTYTTPTPPVPDVPEKPNVPEEPEVPSAREVPATGGSANMMLWSILLVVSSGMIAALVLNDRKKKIKEMK